MPSNRLDELLIISIDAALSKVFDRNTMKAVDFYVDRRVALSNPREYSKSMRKLFGEGSKVLLEKIIEGISSGAGLEPGRFNSLEECVAGAKAKMTTAGR